MTASEQGKWEAAALASDASSYWLLENNPHSTRGPGNLLGSVVAESRQSKTCCFVGGGKGQVCARYVRAERIHFSSQIDSFSQTYINFFLEFFF